MRQIKWQKSLALLALAIFATSVALSFGLAPSRAQGFVDRILRPCGGTSRGSVIVTTTDIQMVPCPGGAVTINGVPITTSGAPASATYITQTANATLTNEQALASLASGIMRVATTTGVVTSLTNSAGIAANISDETGTGVLVFSTSPVLVTPDLGTPSALVLTNATGLPLATGVTGDLPFANLVQASAASRLIGRGSAAGAGDYQEITLGAGLTLTGTVLSATGSGGTVTGTGTPDTVTKFTGAAVIGDASFTDTGSLVAFTTEVQAPLTVRTGNAADTDLAGELTVGGGGTVTYTFTQTYTTAPVCVANDTDATPLPVGASATTTTLTIIGAAGHVVTYICIGRN